MPSGRANEQRPFRVETVYGKPTCVGGRKLIPVARHVSFGKARATIGPERTAGWGMGFALTVPMAIIEETASGQRRVAITDATSRALRWMFGAAVGSIILLVAIRCLAERRRHANA